MDQEREEKPKTPWADIKKEEEDKRTPWEKLDKPPKPAESAEKAGKKEAKPAPERKKETPRERRWFRDRLAHSDSKFPDAPTQERAEDDDARVSSSHYAAVEVHGWFGLIDHGCPSKGVRELVAHTPRNNGGYTLDRLRAGQQIKVQPTSGPRHQEDLRVRFTTPARYYAPGARITTLAVGVDDSAWTKVVRTRPNI